MSSCLRFVGFEILIACFDTDVRLFARRSYRTGVGWAVEWGRGDDLLARFTIAIDQNLCCVARQAELLNSKVSSRLPSKALFSCRACYNAHFGVAPIDQSYRPKHTRKEWQ